MVTNEIEMKWKHTWGDQIQTNMSLLYSNLSVRCKVTFMQIKLMIFLSNMLVHV